MRTKRRKKRLLLIFFLLVFLTGMVIVGAEIFQIKKVTVSGNEKILYNYIVKLSGISLGDNIFRLNKEVVKKRIETNPYLEVISIGRKLPSEVIIKVKERKPAAVVPYLGSYILIDKEGIILEILTENNCTEYPLVQDIRIKSFAEGRRLTVGDEYQLRVLCRLLQVIYDQEVQDSIAEISFKDVNDIYMISREGIKIRLGQAIDIEKKIAWLKTDVLCDIKNVKKQGVLDLSVPGKAVFRTYEN